MDIQKVKSSFFQDKSNVRKVDIKLFILEEWGDQEIVSFIHMQIIEKKFIQIY